MAKYADYYDYTYKEVSKVVYDEESSREYEEYEVNYQKVTDKDELKNWGSKKVYAGDFIYDRIVVYDGRIITISSYIDYNKENINIIKSKIVN